MKYENSKYPEYAPISYSILNLDRLKNFSIINDSINHTPNITYNITANGGHYLSQAFSDLYTLGCYEYNSVEEAMKLYLNKELPLNLLKDYKNVQKLSIDLFNLKTAYVLKYERGRATYTIEMWQACVDYCVCKLYMESPTQPIYGDFGAYVKSIKSVHRPSNNTIKKMDLLLRDIIDVDIKYQ